MLNEPAAEHWSDRRSDRRKSRPRSYRFAALFFVKGRTDQCETSRHQEGAADSLHCASNDQLFDVGGKTAESRGDGEDHDADIEDTPPAITIAERTTDEQECGKKEGVRFNDPLYSDRGGV